MSRRLILAAVACLAGAAELPITPARREAIEKISAASLRGHVSFLASDLLEGRATPSRGLDIAAEYIAAQFRRAGLEPAGDDGYFQTANWFVREMNREGLELTIESAGGSLRIPAEQVTMNDPAAVDISASAVKVRLDQTSALTADQIRGRVVFAVRPDVRGADASRRREMFRATTGALDKLRELGAELVLTAAPAFGGGGGQPGALVDPELPARGSPVTLSVRAADYNKLVESLADGPVDVNVTAKIGTPVERPARLRNVVGVLKGADPALGAAHVLLSAHYDHIGVRTSGEGDRIFNGANDDASGTAAVMEIAAALGAMKERPRRSIVFAAWFGEERGLLGARYYVRRPLLALDKTVANLNLEHLGRTDTSDGAFTGSFHVTGYDYTSIPAALESAADWTGVRVLNLEEKGDSFFARSDNLAFAQAGVPAHTLSVGYEFPEYHQVGDHWDKLDYANMEKVTRAIAAGVVGLASGDAEPRWNESNLKTAPYVEAWNKRRPPVSN